MDKTRRRLLFKLSAAGLALALGLIGAELSLRLGALSDGSRGDTDSWHTFDPTLGWRAKPHWSGEGTVPGPEGARFAVRTNGQGLRHDREVAPVASPGVTRLCAVGDSFTFGFGVPVEGGFVAQLDAALGPQAEVLNLGTCAWGLGQMRLAVDEQALPLQPDLILITVIRQNFRRALRTVAYSGQLKPRFVLWGDGVRLVNTPLPEPPEGGQPYTDMPPEGGSFVLWKLGALLDKAGAALAGGGEANNPRWKLGSAILRDAKRAAEDAGVPLVVVLYPTVKGLAGKAPYRELLGDEADLLVCDLYPAFEAAGATPGEHFLPDGHPTPQGHAVAAAALATFLRDRGLVR